LPNTVRFITKPTITAITRKKERGPLHHVEEQRAQRFDIGGRVGARSRMSPTPRRNVVDILKVSE
jgi:hypothetical protein